MRITNYISDQLMNQLLKQYTYHPHMYKHLNKQLLSWMCPIALKSHKFKSILIDLEVINQFTNKYFNLISHNSLTSCQQIFMSK